jgi:hypothetical protein
MGILFSPTYALDRELDLQYIIGLKIYFSATGRGSSVLSPAIPLGPGTAAVADQPPPRLQSEPAGHYIAQ